MSPRGLLILFAETFQSHKCLCTYNEVTKKDTANLDCLI